MEYFIDLLLNDCPSKTLVAVELKIGAFERQIRRQDGLLPERAQRERKRAPDDAPSIGIVLCAEKDSLEVEFALKCKSN